MKNKSVTLNLPILLEYFDTSNWKEIIDPVSNKGYSAMWMALSDAKEKAIEPNHGKVLKLLADACSMMLSPSSINEPFKPLITFEDGNPVIPDNFSESDIQFFEEILNKVDNNWLKARLCDLVWLKKKPRNTEFALKAIDAYCSLPLDNETWKYEGCECYCRAISLAKLLKKGAVNWIQKIEKKILTKFNETDLGDGFFAAKLANYLKSNKLGNADNISISKKLEALAREYEGKKDWYPASEYYSDAADWYNSIPDKDKYIEMTFLCAQCWEKRGDVCSVSENSNNIAAKRCYEKAIQICRTIPRSARSKFHVDEYITMLWDRLSDSGMKVVEEEISFETFSIDISRYIEMAEKAVRGKSVCGAFNAFINKVSKVKFEKLREQALNHIDKYPIQFNNKTETMSNDGRVIAKCPANSLEGKSTDYNEDKIHNQMISEYENIVAITVKGFIRPALDVLLLEHRLCEKDFIELARNSPIVPLDRAGLLGKALFAGFDRDFVTALHILIPQIEHLVRELLKQAGAKTTNLDKNGIENENGMSTLMGLPEAKQVFGEDLAFEMDLLFCNSSSSNLRNRLAHGLLNENDCNSASAIYAWWLTLRIIFNTYLNTAYANFEN